MSEPVSARGPVAVFDSVHTVLAAERMFLTAGLACDLVPIPRGVTSDCGLALLFRTADMESARTLLSHATLGGRLRGIFVPGPDGYTPDAMNAPGPADGGSHPGPAETNGSNPDPAETNGSNPDRREPRP